MAEATAPAVPPQPAPQPSRAKTVPILHPVTPIDQRANVWRWQARDAAGNTVVPAEGATHFESRGPTSKQEMIDAARLWLNNKRLDAIRAGQNDPGYEVIPESVVPVRDSNQGVEGVGVWQPTGAKPVQFPHESEPGLAAGTVLPDQPE